MRARGAVRASLRQPPNLGMTAASIERWPQPRSFTPQQLSDPLGLSGDLYLPGGAVDLVLAVGWHERARFFHLSPEEVVRGLKVGGREILCQPQDDDASLAAPEGSDAWIRGSLRRLRTGTQPELHPISVYAKMKLRCRSVTAMFPGGELTRRRAAARPPLSNLEVADAK